MVLKSYHHKQETLNWDMLAKNRCDPSNLPLYSIYIWWDIHVGLVLYRGGGNISFVLFLFGILSLTATLLKVTG